MSEATGMDRVWRYQPVAQSLGISTKTLQRAAARARRDRDGSHHRSNPRHHRKRAGTICRVAHHGWRMTVVQLDRAVEIERLAALDTVDYEIARKEAADRLGLRASVLDDLRTQKRRELKLESAKTDDGQGRALTLPEIMPWSEPVEGDCIASALTATISQNRFGVSRAATPQRPLIDRAQ